MSALTKQETHQQLPDTAHDNSGGLLAVIERAARDPSVDIDKMERLLQMQERVQARQAKAAYDDAMAEMQPKLPIITERGKILNKSGGTQSTYAYWEDINEIIKPILAEHGFALSFKGKTNGNMVVTVGILSHRLGHREETEVELPKDDSGSKNVVQGIGSSKSYGKRYAAFDLLNITTKGEDDDGRAASSRRVDGEPMPRTKLEGKYTSKSALQAALRELAHKLSQVASDKELAILLKEYGPAITQCEKDLPVWWAGDGTPEKQGLEKAIENKRSELAEPDTLNMLMDAMRQNQTVMGLAKWAASQELMIDTLSDEKRRKFEAEYDAFEAGLHQLAVANS